MKKIEIYITSQEHLAYTQTILDEMGLAAKIRGTGIAKRSPEYLRRKISDGKAIIALDDEKFVGFCYIETWEKKQFVANSGLIVAETYRGKGLARKIKAKAFQLSRQKYPNAKIFGLTTGLAVMKINSDIGYRPVTFSELTNDDVFWQGCQSCINYDILMRTKRKHCLCTGMIFDPEWKEIPPKPILSQAKRKHRRNLKQSIQLYSRWMRIKKNILLKSNKRNNDGNN